MWVKHTSKVLLCFKASRCELCTIAAITSLLQVLLLPGFGQQPFILTQLLECQQGLSML